MGDIRIDANGFKELEEILARYGEKTENVTEILETGAREFANDVRRLPKPRSKVRKAGYTHLLDSISYRRKNGEIEVGWGKYYGPIVEHRGKKHSGRNGKGTPHFYPTFRINKEKYYNIMIQKGGL